MKVETGRIAEMILLLDVDKFDDSLYLVSLQTVEICMVQLEI